VFILLAVFETVLFVLNVIPAAFSFAANQGKGAPSAGYANNSFTVDAGTPSPNIYWLFMDGMLGFEGMERLFGDRQAEFAAALAGQGFVINRNAGFEAFHYTGRSTAILMSPGWYDREFLPLLATVNIDDYRDKEKKLGNINPMAARWNNELLGAFRSKGYTVYSVSDLGLYSHTLIYNSADTVFYKDMALRNLDYRFFNEYIQFCLLNELLRICLAPWRLTGYGKRAWA
jgi:hypothetical protein